MEKIQIAEHISKYEVFKVDKHNNFIRSMGVFKSYGDALDLFRVLTETIGPSFGLREIRELKRISTELLK